MMILSIFGSIFTTADMSYGLHGDGTSLSRVRPYRSGRGGTLEIPSEGIVLGWAPPVVSLLQWWQLHNPLIPSLVKSAQPRKTGFTGWDANFLVRKTSVQVFSKASKNTTKKWLWSSIATFNTSMNLDWQSGEFNLAAVECKGFGATSQQIPLKVGFWGTCG